MIEIKSLMVVVSMTNKMVTIETQGVVLCSQTKIVAWKARKAEFIEAAPDYITADVIARLSTLLE